MSSSDEIILDNLAHLPVWVGWREVQRNGDATKVPYNPRTGEEAKSTDPTTWSTRGEAETWAAFTNHGGVGIVLSQLNGGDCCLCGIDLDTCRDPNTETLQGWAQEVIERFKTYTEVSPSGTGAKLFFMHASADLPAIERLFDGKGGRQFKNGGGRHCPAIEIYRSGRYFTVTDESIGQTDILRQVPLADLEWLIHEAGPRFAHKESQKSGSGTDQSRSAKAFRKGAALKATGSSYAAMRDALLADADPEIAKWARTKGLANNERELHRIYDNAGDKGAAHVSDGVLDKFVTQADARTLHHHRAAFYKWNGRAYLDKADGELRAEIYPFLDQSFFQDQKGNLHPVKPHASMVTNVLDGLRAASHLDGSISAPAWIRPVSSYPAEQIVACENGLLHLPTGKIIDNTPEFFTYNALDFAYDPDAPEPRQLLDFLLQLWPNDQQSIATLQEIFGYCLTGDTRQQKAFLLIGPRRSGKGTIARILARLIGTANTAAPTLAGLGTNFGIAPLIGKRVAIISDARLGGRADQHAIAERILSITGEDAITIDRKYTSAWTGQLQTRFVVISNELPRLADSSGSLASRFIVLLLTESFYGREDQQLTAKLLTELPGILNWAITGWHRLQKFGCFKQPDSANDAVQQLEDLGSPIAAFVREKCEKGPFEISVDRLFRAWCEWCSDQGRDRPGTKQTFGRDLRAACPGLKVTQPRHGDERERAYQGIRIKY
jgi:putative DNA primase/helicase